jgi:hypothetical protein
MKGAPGVDMDGFLTATYVALLWRAVLRISWSRQFCCSSCGAHSSMCKQASQQHCATKQALLASVSCVCHQQ